MKPSLKKLGLLCLTFLGLGAATVPAQTTPVWAGAVNTAPGSKLAFVNGAELSSASGYVQPMIHGAFSNRIPATNFYYFTTNLLFTALSATNETSKAAIGANLVCEIVSVQGPAGAAFHFWEQGSFWPTYTFPVGGTYLADKSRFDVSDIALGAGRPDGDPYGEIPGRRFSVSHPGEYLVTFRLHDISENNPTAAAPIHTPSDPLVVKFQTGIAMSIARVAVTNGNVATLTYQPSGFTNVVIEAAPVINPETWTAVAGPFASAPVNASLATAVITNETAFPNQFYRLRLVEE